MKKKLALMNAIFYAHGEYFYFLFDTTINVHSFNF